MTLSEYASHICSKLGKTDSVSLGLCKDYLRRHYKTIWDSALWHDSLVLVTKLADDDELIMPEVVDKVIRVRYDNATPIYGVEPQVLFDIDPQIFEASGTPASWSTLMPLATAALPAGETLGLVSDHADDTAIEVLIRGERNGVPKRETITLNGITPVVTSSQWDLIHTLSKEESLGTVTVSGSVSGAMLLTLWGEESEKKFRRIRLHRQPAELTKHLLVLGKRRFQPLENDLDTPVLSGIDNALIAFATADMLERMRQYGKAQAKLQEAGGYLSAMKAQERDQSGVISQIIPSSTSEGEYHAATL